MILALTLATLVGPTGATDIHPEARTRLEARVVAQEVNSVGAQTELSLLLLERPERQMPIVVRLYSETATLLDRSMGWDEVVDDLAQQPRMRARVEAGPGSHEVRAEVSYVVCGPKWCRQKRAETAWIFSVE